MLRVKEEFLGFKEGRHLVEQQRLRLSDIVLNSLKKYKVNTNTLPGQGYDGAANVAGIRNGVQAKVRERREDYPDATYVPLSITCIKSQHCPCTIAKIEL